MLAFNPPPIFGLGTAGGFEFYIQTRGAGGARHSVGTGVMGGMLAATFLAIFFVPMFFRVISARRLREPRSTEELQAEARHAHTSGHAFPHHVAKEGTP